MPSLLAFWFISLDARSERSALYFHSSRELTLNSVETAKRGRRRRTKLTASSTFLPSFPFAHLRLLEIASPPSTGSHAWIIQISFVGPLSELDLSWSSRLLELTSLSLPPSPPSLLALVFSAFQLITSTPLTEQPLSLCRRLLSLVIPLNGSGPFS